MSYDCLYFVVLHFIFIIQFPTLLFDKSRFCASIIVKGTNMDLPGTSLNPNKSNEGTTKGSFRIDDQDRTVCKICKIKFSRFSNLNTHIKRKHPEEIHLISKKAGTGSLVCRECGVTFKRLSGLNQHTRKKHPGIIEKLISKKIKCAICDYISATKADIMSHYNRHHEIVVNDEYLEFDSVHNFQLWKEKVERETFSSFVNKHGIRKSVNIERVQYECHRSGEYKSRGNNIRSPRHRGSRKINGFCPAQMNVLFAGTKCTVHFCNTHIGHKQDKDLRQLFLSKSDKEKIAAKISAKVPFQSILDENRGSMSNGRIERIHLLEKQDLYNIERSFNLNNFSVRHKHDAVSNYAWLNELKESESVLYYKPQDSSSEFPGVREEDLVLIIMTPEQKELLLRSGNDCVCMDGINSLSGDGFELHTLLVLDKMREAYPGAFLISNKTDAAVIEMFYSCIQRAIGKLRPKIFMSDMAEIYYKAWINIMQPPEFRLFCTWHVDKAWQKNLDKIGENEEKALVYQMLRILCQESDQSTFQTLLQQFLEYCQSKKVTEEFGKHFQSHYALTYVNWAHCYWPHSNLNTNLERMHNTIEHFYLSETFAKRPDKAICAIRKFVRDEMYNRLNTIDDDEGCIKLSDLREKHKSSELLDSSNVVEIDVGWLVPSASSNGMYVVERLSVDCSCQLVCNECRSCIHQFSCSCLDYSIKWNMCRHIHLVCRFINEIPVKEGDVEKSSGDEYNHENKGHEELIAILQERSSTQEETHFAEDKNDFILTLTNYVNQCRNSEELDILKRLNAPFLLELQALRKSRE